MYLYGGIPLPFACEIDYVIISYVDIMMLHVNIILLHVDLNNSRVNLNYVNCMMSFILHMYRGQKHALSHAFAHCSDIPHIYPCIICNKQFGRVGRSAYQTRKTFVKYRIDCIDYFVDREMNLKIESHTL